MTTSVHNQCTSWCGGRGSNLMKSRHWVSMNASVIRENKKKQKTLLCGLLFCNFKQTSSSNWLEPSQGCDVLPCRLLHCRAARRHLVFPAAGSLRAASRAVSWSSPGRNRFVQSQHRGSEAAVNHRPSGARRCGPGQEGAGAGGQRAQPRLTREPLSAIRRFPCFTRGALNFAQIGKRRGELKEWP